MIDFYLKFLPLVVADLVLVHKGIVMLVLIEAAMPLVRFAQMHETKMVKKMCVWAKDDVATHSLKQQYQMPKVDRP